MRVGVRLGCRLYDVVVVGGGMVGSTVAASLASKPQFKDKRILVLDAAKSHPPKSGVGYANRVSAISPASRRLFEELGLWDNIQATTPHATVNRMRVWESCSQAHVAYGNSEGQPLAHIIENDSIIRSVQHRLSQCPNVDVQYETMMTPFLPKDSSTLASLESEEGDSIECSLVIGADGARSNTRDSCHMPVVSSAYNQRAVVATIKCDTPSDLVNHTAWQRFTPTGPIALLPLDHQTFSLVWTTTPQHAKRLTEIGDREFMDELNSFLCDNSKEAPLANRLLHLMSYLPMMTSSVVQLPPRLVDVVENSRASFPLSVGHSVHYCSPRLCLVGDAAHWLHPLAGQGVNLGFGDVTCLTRVICNAIHNGADIGSLTILKEYERERELHNVPVQGVIHALNLLYSNSFTPFVLARSLGLTLVDSSPLLKSFITSRASA